MMAYEELMGQRCLLKRKGEEKARAGRISDFSEDGVLFVYDNWSIPLIPHAEIESLRAMGDEPEPEPEPESEVEDGTENHREAAPAPSRSHQQR